MKSCKKVNYISYHGDAVSTDLDVKRESTRNEIVIHIGIVKLVFDCFI